MYINYLKDRQIFLFKIIRMSLLAVFDKIVHRGNCSLINYMSMNIRLI